MEERVYRFKRTAENLPSIARGIDPNEKNHHILNHFTGSRTTGALTDKRGTTRRGHAAEGSGSLSLFNGDCPRHSSSGLDVFQRRVSANFPDSER